MAGAPQKDQEIVRLKRIIEAYEKLTEFSHQELLEADRTIQAHEQIQGMSAEEIRALHRRIDTLKHENTFRKRIKAILQEDMQNESKILESLERIRRSSTEDFLVDLFRVLVHYEFEGKEAQNYWDAIIKHNQEMAESLGRPVGLRVALLDFFINQNKILKNPMIIEISIFDEMMKNNVLDELTQVYNRRYFDRTLMREINRARRHNGKLTLFLFDIDNFKKYNDTHGHTAGDEALKCVGRMLNSEFRREDTPCRYGGEEFVVIMPETSAEAAMLVAGRFSEKVAATQLSSGNISISGGVSSFPLDGEEPGELFLQADRALYRAKADGKNRILHVADL